MRRNEGFTLLELTVSVAILAGVAGMLFILSSSLGQAARIQEARMTAIDDARSAMLFVVRNIRQASIGSMAVAPLPAASLSFRAAEDLDGNGLAVNQGVDLELSPIRTLRRDTQDANGDGITADQLVMVEGNAVRVVANGLMDNEDLNGSNALDAGEDANNNGRLDRGLWFERVGQGVRVTIQMQHQPDPQQPPVISTLVETVVPRN